MNNGASPVERGIWFFFSFALRTRVRRILFCFFFFARNQKIRPPRCLANSRILPRGSAVSLFLLFSSDYAGPCQGAAPLSPKLSIQICITPSSSFPPPVFTMKLTKIDARLFFRENPQVYRRPFSERAFPFLFPLPHIRVDCRNPPPWLPSGRQGPSSLLSGAA